MMSHLQRRVREWSKRVRASRARPARTVPAIERRQSKRYLTLRNFGYVAIGFLLLFVVITIRSEMRGGTSGGYGRLMGRGLPVVEQEPMEVVTESSPVGAQRSADPILIAPAQREQWLIDPETIADVRENEPVPRWASSVEVTSSEKDGLMVVGGPDGVEVVRQRRPRPILSGGFGR